MDNMTLEDHIDTPIKKCVVGLALLGYKPIFSCCGFNYKGEKVKKDHLERPYIYLDYAAMSTTEKETLLEICRFANWKITFLNINLVNIQGDCWEEGQIWAKKDSPHYYEMAVLSLNRLEASINKLRPRFFHSSVIVDGNKIYQESFKIKHWQYEASPDWKVTPELYEVL